MKKIIMLLSSVLIVLTCFTRVYAENDTKIIDKANILSQEQTEKLSEEINQYVLYTGYDMVVYIVENDPYLVEHDATDSDAITKLADDYYDENGYGYGDERDGLMLFVDIGVRNFTITTCGSSCIDTYTDNALEDIYSDLEKSFGSNEWAEGILTFVNDAFTIYDNYDEYHTEVAGNNTNPAVAALLPAFIGAIVITLICFFVLRKQLINTGIKHTATSYMSNQKINLLRSGEIYLFTEVLKEKIEKPKSEGSSSTTHTSSSGTTHGGGGSHHF